MKSRRSHRSLFALAGRVASLALATATVTRAQVEPVPLGEVLPEAAIVDHVLRDLDGDGRVELVLASRDGRIEVWGLGRDGALGQLGEPLALADPDHSLLALADLLGEGALQLAVLGRRGAQAFRFRPGAGFAGDPVALTTEPALAVRAGAPTFSPFVQDVNADGRDDLLIPRGESCELWLRVAGSGDDNPLFQRGQVLPLRVELERAVRGDLLSSNLRNRVKIPTLDVADCNGDGRPDLRVEEGNTRSFFLQRADGRFAAEPIAVDLGMFRDTTPKADVELGETVVLGDEARIQSGDLDADGIDDHVIAHRRKLWTFLSSDAGPQFTKATTRMVAEDISGLLLLHLDEDDREDLLILKIELPSAADLLIGFVSSIDIEITVLGYLTETGGSFADRARWRRNLTLRIPSITRMMSEADDLMERFMDVLGKFRWSALGDFDGDGSRDLALMSEDETSIELWRNPAQAEDLDRAGERWVRSLLFEDPDTVFDVDRVLQLIAQVFDVRTASMTGDREPDGSSPLPERPGRFLVDVLAGDWDGDGRDELLLVDDAEEAPGARQFHLFQWRNR